MTVPFSISGNKRFKNAHKPTCLLLQEVQQEGNGPLHWKPANFSGLALIRCWPLIFVPVLITTRLGKWPGSQEGCRDMVLSQKEQCLMENCATSSACPAAPCLCKGDKIAPFRACMGQTTSSMFWGQMSGRKKNGAGPWKVLRCHFLILRKELRKVVACYRHRALH